MELLTRLGKKLYKMWMPLAAVIFWGLSFIATKIALQQTKPEMIILIRLIISIPLLIIYLQFTGKTFSITGKQALMVSLLAIISIIHLLIQLVGLQYTTAANSGWIIGTIPVFMAIVGRIFLKEKVPLKKIIGIGISIFGLLLLVSKGHFTVLSMIQSKGDLLVLASCITWSIYSLINRNIAREFSPVAGILYLFIFMLIFLVPYSYYSNGYTSVTNFSWQVWGSLIFLGVFCSFAGYILWAKALQTTDMVNVASVLYIESFVTFLGSCLILHEPITAVSLLSGAVIMSGVALVYK
ncbi:MAG: DMT family transporter [Ignavibacteria bacterium]|nr:DMT family transporter [Ignavibacteria bacterium]